METLTRKSASDPARSGLRERLSSRGYSFLRRASITAWLPLGCMTLFSLPAFAGEYAVLTSGLRIHVERHEIVDGMVRLYSSSDSFTQVGAEMVTGFEQDDYVPPPPVDA